MKRKIGTTNHFSIAALTVSMILIVCHGTQAFQPWKNGRLAPIGRADPGDASHESITEQAVTEICAEQQFPGPDKDALETIVAANGNTDFKEQFDSAAHFDCEEFRAAKSRLPDGNCKKYRGASRRAILAQARNQLGQALHTIQDFYSHSNWVENNVEYFSGPRNTRMEPRLEELRLDQRARLVQRTPDVVTI